MLPSAKRKMYIANCTLLVVLIAWLRWSRWGSCIFGIFFTRYTIVTIASVCGAFVLSKSVGSGGWCDRNRLNGVKSVDQWFWAIFVYIISRKFMSLCCSCPATWCRSIMVIVLWDRWAHKAHGLLFYVGDTQYSSCAWYIYGQSAGKI